MERAFREQKPDLRTIEDLCPERTQRPTETGDTAPTVEDLALSRALIERLCEVDAQEPMTCVTSRDPAYAALVENSASSVFFGAFTRIGVRQAILAVGTVSVLFEWSGSKFEPRDVLSDIELEFEHCLVVTPSGHASQIACFQRSVPGPNGLAQRTVLDIHDFVAMQTARLFSFSNTYLTSCGNVDGQLLLDLVPSEISTAQHQLAPRAIVLTASYLVAHKPATYDRACLDLLHRNFEMGPPLGDTASLVCSLPPYSETTLGFTFASGAWQPSPATESLLERLDIYSEADAPWRRTIQVQPTASR